MAGDTDEPCSAGLTSQLQQAVATLHRRAVSALLTSDAPSVAAVAEIASHDTTGVAQAVAWLTSQGALERDGDRLVGAHGLTHRTTPHALAISNRALHTWSAPDALAIPIALDATAQATTTCPTCGQTLAIDIRAGHLPYHADLVVWMPDGPSQNTCADFHDHANLYCNPEHLTTWHRNAGSPPGHALRHTDVPAVARDGWADIAGVPTGA